MAKNGRPYFQITDFDKDNPKDPNYITVFSNNDIELTDNCKVKIIDIESTGVKHYKGKMQVTMACTVELSEDGESATPNEARIDTGDVPFNTGKLLDISSDDLPF